MRPGGGFLALSEAVSQVKLPPLPPPSIRVSQLCEEETESK